MKCQIGDLCRVIWSSKPENIGGLVEVVYASDEEPGLWGCKALQPLRVTDVVTGSTKWCIHGYIAGIKDQYLEPIRGQRTADPVHSLISEEAGA